MAIPVLAIALGTVGAILVITLSGVAFQFLKKYRKKREKLRQSQDVTEVIEEKVIDVVQTLEVVLDIKPEPVKVEIKKAEIEPNYVVLPRPAPVVIKPGIDLDSDETSDLEHSPKLAPKFHLKSLDKKKQYLTIWDLRKLEKIPPSQHARVIFVNEGIDSQTSPKVMACKLVTLAKGRQRRQSLYDFNLDSTVSSTTDYASMSSASTSAVSSSDSSNLSSHQSLRKQHRRKRSFIDPDDLIKKLSLATGTPSNLHAISEVADSGNEGSKKVIDVVQTLEAIVDIKPEPVRVEIKKAEIEPNYVVLPKPAPVVIKPGIDLDSAETSDLEQQSMTERKTFVDKKIKQVLTSSDLFPTASTDS